MLEPLSCPIVLTALSSLVFLLSPHLPRLQHQAAAVQAARSGMRQLPLQLSQQTSSQQQQEQQPSQQAAPAAAEAAPALGAGPKSGVAALMRLGKPSTNGEAPHTSVWQISCLLALIQPCGGYSNCFWACNAAPVRSRRYPCICAGTASTAAPSSGPAIAAELWVGVHAPTSEADLVVHKKKVQEVQQWLEWQRSSLGRPGVRRVAVVTGERERGPKKVQFAEGGPG